MDLHRAIELVEQFIVDPRYQQAVVYNQYRQIFDVISPGETSLSKVIAWLLNPKEGHGLGDYFIKALLRDAVANDREIFPLTLLDVEQLALQNLNVCVEYLHAYGENKRYIDILATDLSNKLIIVVEHKYGSKEQNNQLAAYSQWAESLVENDPDLRLVRILMDGHETFTREILQSSEQEKWAIVSHQWLITALENIVHTDSLQESARWVLKDLLIHLTSRYDLDASFAEPYAFIKSMASDHRELVKNSRLIEVETTDGKRHKLYEWDDVDFLQWKSVLMSEQYSQIGQLHQFLVQNASLLLSLEQYHHLEWIEEKLNQTFPGQYTCDLYPGVKTYLEIFKNDWEKFQNKEQDYWPFYLELIDQTVGEKRQHCLIVYGRRTAFIEPDFGDAFAAKFNKRLAVGAERRYRLAEVKLEEPTTSELMLEITEMLKRIDSVLLSIY
ncbi:MULTISPECIES: PD-(D/E)XK nuclease family protein [unclassified Endozoicomonas]|uniref:PDDEXK-like family protein n=1 Tax=unclassified Endozoicomonas TaxID=2644528 RepID=UPI002148C2B3|nr:MULTISPECIES: PD-(D/E)XK nuclease family protein [unclassified Endozoicomonas]